MKELLDSLARVFGGKVTVAVTLIVGGYHLTLGAFRLFQAVRDHRLNSARTASLKSRFELLGCLITEPNDSEEWGRKASTRETKGYLIR